MNRVERIAYTVGQGARVAWFLGHYSWARRRVTREEQPEITVEAPMPSRVEMRRDMLRLFERDRANIAAGYYRLPHDLLPDPRSAVRASRLFLSEIDVVNRRRLEGGHQEVFEERRGDGRYPRYYLQNFHYQSDGWLSDRSAALYDFQVEVLFTGSADAMRRQALVPLARFLDGRPLAGQPMLDIACGTGRFLTFVKQNYPRLPVTGLDLSRPYLDRARRNLEPWSWASLIEGNAERLPFADGSLAVVSCIYLFHELPRKVRATVAAEIARVLRPGGLFLFVDSIQRGDEPAFDGLVDFFPLAYHEPYYADYAQQDLVELFSHNGLTVQLSDRAFMSKVLAFAKPD